MTRVKRAHYTSGRDVEDRYSQTLAVFQNFPLPTGEFESFECGPLNGTIFTFGGFGQSNGQSYNRPTVPSLAIVNRWRLRGDIVRSHACDRRFNVLDNGHGNLVDRGESNVEQVDRTSRVIRSLLSDSVDASSGLYVLEPQEVLPRHRRHAAAWSKHASARELLRCLCWSLDLERRYCPR